jgi:hypothetical protein
VAGRRKCASVLSRRSCLVDGGHRVLRGGGEGSEGRRVILCVVVGGEVTQLHQDSMKRASLRDEPCMSGKAISTRSKARGLHFKQLEEMAERLLLLRVRVKWRQSSSSLCISEILRKAASWMAPCRAKE